MMLLKCPSAFLPIAMSIAAISLLLGHIGIYGITRGDDEHTAGHIFQLLIIFQLPIACYFAVRWAPRLPRESLAVLGVQAALWLAACAAAYFLT